MVPYFNQRVLQNLLQKTVLSWMKSGDLTLCVAQKNWMVPDGIALNPKKPASRGASRPPKEKPRETSWADLNLDCRSEPVLLFVLEGEADIRVGRPAEPIAEGEDREASAARKEVSVYSLPARSCLLLPPDIAHSDGCIPHWERPHPENARSQILWMVMMPTGALVYVCQTEGLAHSYSTALFVRDLQLLPVVQFLLDRSSQSLQSDPLVLAFLSALLLCVERNLSANHVFEDALRGVPQDSSQEHGPQRHDIDAQTEAFELACLYIGSHLANELTPAQIARNARISVSQLKRMFRTRLGTSVMKYVMQRRIEVAEDLLLRTGLSIQEIGVDCGFAHPAHFSRVFKQHSGLAPLAFRRRAAGANRTGQ